MNNNKMNAGAFLPYTMWFLPTFFYTLQFVIRSSAGLMTTDWMETFSITASQVGTIVFMRTIGYSFMQLPIGILLDKVSPRIIGTIFFSICSIGVIISALAFNYYLLLLGSLLFGIGAAAGFACANKILVLWFPQKAYSTMTGLSFALILCGAVMGKDIVEFMRPELWHNIPLLNQLQPWQNVLLLIGCIEIIITIMFFMVVRKPANQDNGEEINKPVTKAKDVFFKVITNGKIIYIAILGGLMVGVLEAFGFAWGDLMLISRYDNIGLGDVGSITKMIAIGMIVFSPIIGYFGDKYNLHKTLTVTCALAMFGGMWVCVYVESSVIVLKIAMFFIGAGCTYQILLFAIAVGEMPASQSATVVGIVQSLNMLFASLYPKIIGFLLDHSWAEHGTMLDNVRNYLYADYQFAFAWIFAGLALGGIGILFVKTKSQ